MYDEQDNSNRLARQSLTGIYETLLELGRGGMGTVHLARAVGQGGFERLVVLKRMHAHLLAEAGATDRFVDESRIAAQLHHANIVGIQHVGSDEQGYFLVFDYIEGESLQTLLEQATSAGQGLPLRVVVRILLDGLAGLHAAHTAEDVMGQPLKILHRDVSPHNLLVGRDGSTRLADFGIARDVRRTALTTPGLLVGKTLYMPPEYLRGANIDVRLDVYGVGVSAWVALAGDEPWPNAPDPQVIYAVMNDGFPPLSMSRADLPPEIEAVVMRALARDPAERYPTARAMADALSNAAQVTIGVANGDEVGALVEELCGRALASRRRRLAEASGAGRERSSKGSQPLLLPRALRQSAASQLDASAVAETRSQEVSGQSELPSVDGRPLDLAVIKAPRGASGQVPEPSGQRLLLPAPRASSPALGDGFLDPSSVFGTAVSAGGEEHDGGRDKPTEVGRDRQRRRNRAMIGVGAVVVLGAGLLIAARAVGPGEPPARAAARATAAPLAPPPGSGAAPAPPAADIAGVDPNSLPAASADAVPTRGGRGARPKPGAASPPTPTAPTPTAPTPTAPTPTAPTPTAPTPTAPTPTAPTPPVLVAPPVRPDTNSISSANPYR